MDNFLVSSVTVRRPSLTSADAAGGVSPNGQPYTTAYFNLPVSIQPLKGQWVTYYTQRNSEVTHTIYTNQRLSLYPGDYFVFQACPSCQVRYFAFVAYRDTLEAGEVVCVDCLETFRGAP